MEIQVELMVFTLFVCLGAGTFGLQGLLAVMGKGRSLQGPCLVVSLISVIIGGIGSFLHLAHPERIFNGFGHLSSGITQELIGIVVFVLALVLFFVVNRRTEGDLPKWLGVVAIIIAVGLVIVMAHSYNMAARPSWDTPLLWLYYLASAALLGSLAVAVAAAARGDETFGFATRASVVSGVVAAVAVIACLGFAASAAGSLAGVGNYFDPTHPTHPMADASSAVGSLLSGSDALLFWLGAVVVGIVAPVAVALVASRGKETKAAYLAGAGLVCALVGGMCFRAALYIMGFSVFMFY